MGVKDKGRQDVGQDASVTPQDPEEAPVPQGDEVILPNSPSAPAPDVAPAPMPEVTAPAAEPAAFSLNIDAEKKFDTRLGLVKLSWAATGPVEEVYLWSDGFNRDTADAASDDPCGTIGVRHLLVNSKEGANLGYELNDGTPAHDALLPYLDSAQLCDESICEGYTASPGAPSCRIDLDPKISSGSFYTRTLTKDAVYRLCAKTAEGTDCVASSAVTVPTASIESASAGISPEGKVRFTLNYLFAVRGMDPPAGCVKNDGGSNYNDRDRGRGILVADCPIETHAVVREMRNGFGGIPFTAQGIGNGNSDSDRFTIVAGDPVVTVSSPYGFQGKDGCAGENDCEGTVKIDARASRSLTVTRLGTGEALFSGPTTAGIEWVHLQQNDDLILPDGKTGDGLPKTKTIEMYETSGTQALGAAVGEGEVTFTNVLRSHKHYRWRARAIVDGKKFNSASTALPYQPSFRLDQMNPVVSYVMGEVNGIPLPLKLNGNEMKITSHHIKDVGGACWSSAGPASYMILHPGFGYEESKEGRLNPYVIINYGDFSQPVDRSNPLTCRFWGVSYDGQAIDGGTFTWSLPAQ